MGIWTEVLTVEVGDGWQMCEIELIALAAGESGREPQGDTVALNLMPKKAPGMWDDAGSSIAKLIN